MKIMLSIENESDRDNMVLALVANGYEVSVLKESNFFNPSEKEYFVTVDIDPKREVLRKVRNRKEVIN